MVDALFDRVIQHMKDFSFGPSLDENQIKMLKKFLPKARCSIKIRRKNEISVKIAAEIAYEIGVDFSQLKKTDDRRILLEAAFILLFATMPEHGPFISSLTIKDPSTFLRLYPEFCGVDADEMSVLLSFRNVMKIAQQIIPPHYNKRHLLDIVTRIAEGYQQKHVTGGGQTASTSRRVLIYERESMLSPNFLKAAESAMPQKLLDTPGPKLGHVMDCDSGDVEYMGSKRRKMDSFSATLPSEVTKYDQPSKTMETDRGEKVFTIDQLVQPGSQFSAPATLPSVASIPCEDFDEPIESDDFDGQEDFPFSLSRQSSRGYSVEEQEVEFPLSRQSFDGLAYDSIHASQAISVARDLSTGRVVPLPRGLSAVSRQSSELSVFGEAVDVLLDFCEDGFAAFDTAMATAGILRATSACAGACSATRGFSG